MKDIKEIVKYILTWATILFAILMGGYFITSCEKNYKNTPYQTTIEIRETKAYGGFADTRNEIHIAAPPHYKVKDYSVGENEIIINLERDNEEVE